MRFLKKHELPKNPKKLKNGIMRCFAVDSLVAQQFEEWDDSILE